jgi:hypothetical protein
LRRSKKGRIVPGRWTAVSRVRPWILRFPQDDGPWDEGWEFFTRGMIITDLSLIEYSGASVEFVVSSGFGFIDLTVTGSIAVFRVATVLEIKAKDSFETGTALGWLGPYLSRTTPLPLPQVSIAQPGKARSGRLLDN